MADQKLPDIGQHLYDMLTKNDDVRRRCKDKVNDFEPGSIQDCKEEV